MPIILYIDLILMSKFKNITIHRPKSQPLTLEQFSFFLAGLIDADGHINKLGNVIITFHSRDISVAYYIKTRIGYGRVSKHIQKNAITYVCSHPIGKQSICQYIYQKLINPDRIEQLNTRLVPFLKRLAFLNAQKQSKGLKKQRRFKTQNDKSRAKAAPMMNQPGPAMLSLQNHWLAGFIQGDGSFQVKLVSKKNRLLTKKEVRLVLQIDLKQLSILKQLQNLIGGSIGYRASQNTYYYNSVSFQRAAKLIQYLDHFQVMGSSITLYWMWRKCYIMIQNKHHLSQKGINDIAKIKAQMSKLRLN